MSEQMTTTAHRAAALTGASALAMWDAAECTADRVRAGAAMAEVLRAKAAKPKAPKAAPDLLTAQTLAVTMKRMCMIVERKNAIPILSCVLMESAGGMLTISATDLDMLYVETMRAPDLPPFKMAVPAHDLASALVKAGGVVTFRDETLQPKPGATTERWNEAERKNVKVPAEPVYRLTMALGSLEARFIGMPAKDFPIMLPRVNSDGVPYVPSTATMPASRLLGPLGFVKAAISKEETRYYLGGVYMHVTVQEELPALTFAATDGSRLLVDRSEDAAGFDTTMPGVIIPRKSVDWILRNVRDDEVQVDVWTDKLRVTTVTGTYITRLIDGNFPDYNRVVPRDMGNKVAGCADGKAFAQIISRLTAQTKTKSGCVTLRLGDGKAEAFARNMEGGEVRADVPLEYVGPPVDLDFNGRYLADMSEVSEPWTIGFGGPNDPAKVLWPNMPGRCGVLMPLRR